MTPSECVDEWLRKGFRLEDILSDLYANEQVKNEARKRIGLTPVRIIDANFGYTGGFQLQCVHDYVNVGFTSVTMACKHCGEGKQ